MRDPLIAGGCALLVFLGACSYRYVVPPPENRSVVMTTPCTADKTWPWIDVAIAASALVGTTATLLVARETCGDGCGDVGLVGIFYLAVPVSGISALVGSDRVDRCRRRMAAPVAGDVN